MKKLSELPMDTMLTVDYPGDLILMSKKDFLDSSFFLDSPVEPCPPVTAADKSFVNFDLPATIEHLSEGETWEEDVLSAINNGPKAKIIDEAVGEINRIFKDNPTYWEGEPVEIDMVPKDEGGDHDAK